MRTFDLSWSDVDEWEQLRERLSAAGVAGVGDLGRFVSKPEHVGESSFDEQAAMPVLIEALPSLTDKHLSGLWPDICVVLGHGPRPSMPS